MPTWEESADMMLSPDYRQRFKAEVRQTMTRLDKLTAMLDRAEKGTLDFAPTCPLFLLRKQADAMNEYLQCLYLRARLENIKL